MHKKSFELVDIDTQDFYGQNDRNLTYIKKKFPKLKIVARGRLINVSGTEEQIEQFEKMLNSITTHISHYNRLDQSDLDILLSDDKIEDTSGLDVIVHGINGKTIKPLTTNQVKLVQNVLKRDMVFAVGPAGTGKTYTSVALAVRALKNKEVQRIVLTRPAVEAGESLGFLPGDLKDKLDPYLQPLYDALRDMIPYEKLENLIERRIIEVAPLAFMRGRTLDKAFVILDEAQNTTHSQMKMFLTRMGKHAKFIITGDPGQVDLPLRQKSGLREAMHILKEVKDIGFVHLDGKDVVRHKLVGKIITAYQTDEKQSNDIYQKNLR